MHEGFILGICTWLSHVLLVHFPEVLKEASTLKSFFTTDIISIVLLILMTSISKSATAVIASITCGLLVNLTLMVFNRFLLSLSGCYTRINHVFYIFKHANTLLKNYYMQI